MQRWLAADQAHIFEHSGEEAWDEAQFFYDLVSLPGTNERTSELPPVW